MSASTAAEYADELVASIRAAAETDAPFGYVNEWDGSTSETLEDIHGFDPAEHDADNLPEHWDVATAYDYLREVLDVRFIVSSDRSYLNAEVAITLGGPNVWITTADRSVHVYWGFSEAVRPLPATYVDAIDDAAEEMWNNGN